MKRPSISPARLLRAAATAARRAYCPYSRFRVGAAVLTSDNLVFTGCNVENASYGLTVCAERNAVAAAIAGGARRIVAVAVVGGKKTPALPCGACRQVLAEFAVRDTMVYCATPNRLRNPVVWPLRELLPAAFALRMPRTTAHERNAR